MQNIKYFKYQIKVEGHIGWKIFETILDMQ